MLHSYHMTPLNCGRKSLCSILSFILEHAESSFKTFTTNKKKHYFQSLFKVLESCHMKMYQQCSKVLHCQQFLVLLTTLARTKQNNGSLDGLLPLLTSKQQMQTKHAILASTRLYCKQHKKMSYLLLFLQVVNKLKLESLYLYDILQQIYKSIAMKTMVHKQVKQIEYQSNHISKIILLCQFFFWNKAPNERKQ